MKFVINYSGENITTLARKLGYFFFPEKSAEFSFIRPMEKSGYPRFHLYIKNVDKNLIFNLHLDQKKPIYKGVPAHSAEYESEIVEKEAERIKQILK